MMRILHISDTHGMFKPLFHVSSAFDIVVHSGDIFPDFNGRFTARQASQEFWLEKNIDKFKTWLNGKPFFLTLGNHDFADPNEVERILRGAGIEAYNLNDKLVSYQGKNFYGFPYVPIINGMWNYETDQNDMTTHITTMCRTMEHSRVDVLVAHCPPYGILDYCASQRMHFGNSLMTNALMYRVSKDRVPKMYLTGHIHSAKGIAVHEDTMYVNSATTQHELELL